MKLRLIMGGMPVAAVRRRKWRLMDPTAERRARMVSAQLERRGIRSQPVLQAMREVPRERFVEPGMEEFAYEDSPLPIATTSKSGFISQPPFARPCSIRLRGLLPEAITSSMW